jgi:curli biogenesis system outer membrane secretion channel CsgG
MIKFGVFVAAIAAAASVASVAAADGPLSATLQTPLASSSEPVAGGAVFACKADTCVAESDTSDSDNLTMCRDLAREYGPVTKFGSFDATMLAKCNVVAKH